MTTTQLSEALHAVAEATAAPPTDHLELRRRVRRERLRLHASHAAVAVATVAAVLIASASLRPFLHEKPASAPSGWVSAGGSVTLSAPVFLSVDGMLVAIDPQGRRHDLGTPVEEVIGWSSESLYAIGRDSTVLRWDLSNGDEGPGGPWVFDPVDSGIDGAVQSAQLSADGRWLGWIDLDDRLRVRDLKAGTTARRQLPASSYLVDLAQGTGAALISEDADLVLYGSGSDVAIPTQEGPLTWEATATRDRVALVERQGTTRVFDLSTGRARTLAVVPGAGRLSPYGAWVASIGGSGQAGRQAVWVTTPGEEPRELVVPGVPAAVAWGDDDTVLVLTTTADGTTGYACEAQVDACERLDLGGTGTVALPR